MSLNSVFGSALYDTVGLVGNITNPLDDYLLEPSWKYMTNNYSRFTISFWFSIIIHEVLINECMVVLFFVVADFILWTVLAWIPCSVPSFHAKIQNTASEKCSIN